MPRDKLNWGLDATVQAVCPDCNWTGNAADCRDVQDLLQRIAPGGEVPVGECPECGVLCYLVQGRPQIQAALDCLNLAFRQDPAAMHALVCNRVPVNEELAAHPQITVARNPVGLESYSLGVLGVLNGVLTAAGLPQVAAKFTDQAVFVGFCQETAS